MNRLVSINQVGAMWLRLRDANTNIDFGVFKTKSRDKINFDDGIVEFDLTAAQPKLLIGNYYKIQLAYEDISGQVVGYYSTVSITKCTAEPTVQILDLNTDSVNDNRTMYIGQYTNMADPAEKNYQYMFELTLSNGDILYTTDWCYHNANQDTLSHMSEDTYQLYYDITEYEFVYIQYKVKTNNNLICESEKYKITNIHGARSSLLATLKADLDYDNGCMKIFLQPNDINVNVNPNYCASYVGKYVLSRASAKDNYTVWLPIYNFELVGGLPKDALFIDFTCAQGETYQYCIQEYNENNIYSARILSNKTQMKFEHMFLFDGERQLKICFNPKVSSFKTVLQETKKTTLGAKYPFFFSNSIVEYKEFSISGLISYVMDENEYFASKKMDLLKYDELDSFDITDENIAHERRFRTMVLDWLNNGSMKLFRSATEGNYIVRLMNTSLTANDSVSRMLATFQTTATEALEYTDTNLIEYEFLTQMNNTQYDYYYYTIDLAQLGRNSTSAITGKDLLLGYKCSYLKAENINYPSNTRALLCTLGSNKITLGRNSTYEAKFDTPQSILKLTNPNANMSGLLTIGVKCTDDIFNHIKKITSHKQIDYYDALGMNWMCLYEGLEPIDYDKFRGYVNSLNELYQIPLAALYVGDIYKAGNEYYRYSTKTTEGDPNSWSVYKKYNNKNQISKIYSIEFKFNPNASANTTNYRFYVPEYGVVSLTPTQAYIDGTLYNFDEENSIVIINDLEFLPNIIQWGSSISAKICYEILTITYDVDDLSAVKTKYNLYNYSNACVAANTMKMNYYQTKPSTNNITIMNYSGPNSLFYEWNGTSFDVVTTAAEYWKPVLSSAYSTSTSISINNSSYTVGTLISNQTTNKTNYFDILNTQLLNATTAIENKIAKEQNYGFGTI